MSSFRVAIFGSSEPSDSDPLYAAARELGRALAEAGFTVLTGGYTGVMEAASRGAREADGAAVGVTCARFRDRTPNAFLTEVVERGDLHERQAELIRRADAFVVLDGRAGTLAELAMLWALERAGGLESRPVLLLGNHWKPVLDLLGRLGILEQSQVSVTRIVHSPTEAVAAIREATRGPEGIPT